MADNRLRVGVKLTPKSGSGWGLTYTEVELIKSADKDGYTFWWTSATYTDGSVKFETFLDDALKNWDVKQDFYRIGETYDTRSDASFTVLDVYEVDNPELEDDRIMAVTRWTRSDGTQFIEVLPRSSYSTGAYKKVN